MTSPTVDVVYVNYNSTALLLGSVACLLAADCAGFTLGDVVVVDNASEPEQAKLLAHLPRRVQVIHAGSNRGFGAGCNLGARAGKGDAVFFVNPDTRVLPDTLPPLVSALVAHGGRAVVGGRQFMDDGCTLAFAPLHGMSLWGDVVNALWARGYTPELSLRGLRQRVELWRSKSPQPARAVSGGVMLISRAVFKDLAGFDERYFLYVEDSDLCRRARARGVPVLYAPASRIVHYGDQSSQRNAGVASAAAAAGIETYLRTHHGTLARTARRWLLAVTQRLPQRQTRWHGGTLVSRDFTFTRPSAQPWVVEVARSPLFDHGLTAFPDGATFTLPGALWETVRAGRYYARVAEQVRGGKWRERALYVVEHS
jgi:hypothetical protein